MDNKLMWNGINLEWAYGDLLSHLRFKVACPHRAKDLLHDAFIRFALSSSIRRSEQPHAYLQIIAKNVVIDEYHASRRFLEIETHLAKKAEWADSAPSSEQLADVRQRLVHIQWIIDQLPQRCRKVFWLYRIEGHTHPEIAQILGISKNMVERHVMRAIVDLSYAHEK